MVDAPWYPAMPSCHSQFSMFVQSLNPANAFGLASATSGSRKGSTVI